jgi:hypothetical protein
MRVFISWSGDLSHKVAETLRTWLPMMIQSVNPYLSSEDTNTGVRWYNNVASELEASNYGILCVTRENFGNPWINFEAGALSKSVEKGRVSPFLIDVRPAEVTGPLMQFQATIYNYSGALRLVKSINSVTETPLPDALIDRQFKSLWPDNLQRPLDQAIKEYCEPGKVVKPERSAEDMLSELLALTRTQHKTLSDLMSRPEPSGSLNTKIRVLREVDFTEVRYHLKRIRVIADKAVVPGRPETPNMVQLRALIDVLTECLAPALGPE